VAPLPRDRTGGARAPRPGHDGHGNDRIVAIQHARIVAAMVAVVAEHGAAGATVSRVVGRASVSRRTFYELFERAKTAFWRPWKAASRPPRLPCSTRIEAVGRGRSE
jgi:hypothetical protein